MYWATNIVDTISLVSLISGYIAIYYWIKIYKELNKGSLAWLLLTLTSIFMVTTPFYYLISRGSILNLEFIVLALVFWGAVYVSFFAGAGYTLDRTFGRVPRGDVGKYLIEGFRFSDTTMIDNISEDKNDETNQLKADDNLKDTNLTNSEKEQYKTDDSKQSIRGLPFFLGNNALIQYTNSERYEDALIEVTLGFLSGGSNVVLFTSKPRVKVYKKELKTQLELGVVKIVDIIKETGKLSQEEGIITLHIDQSDYIPARIAAFPKQSVILIESKNIISPKNDGKIDIEFITKIIEKAVENEIGVIAFIDIESISESEKNRIMDLFMNQASIIDDKIILIKGKIDGYEIPVLNYVDYDKTALR